MRPVFSIEDLEREAARRLPRIVREYIAGGASTERTIGENRAAFDRILFAARVMVDISRRNTRTTVLGREIAVPVIAGPAGLAPLVHSGGEPAAARAAGNAGSIFCVSNASGCTLEDIAAAATGPVWFQIFSCADRAIASRFIARARECRCHALILSTDLPIGGLRYRDQRNGMEFPPRFALKDLIDFLRHPAWLWNAMTSGRITLGNYVELLADHPDAKDTYGVLTSRVLTPACSWEDLRWLRGQWQGPLVVKGILCPEDAVIAVDHGADALVVSNHGGRQLDWQPATIDVLPGIADAVAGRAEIYIDGGIRHGADVVKSLALGARACLVARPWYWALAAGGEQGVNEMFRIFRHEVDNVLGLLGCPDIADLNPAFLRRPGA